MSLPQLYVIRIIALLQKHFISLFFSYKLRIQKTEEKFFCFFISVEILCFSFIYQALPLAVQSKFSLMGKLKSQKEGY